MIRQTLSGLAIISLLLSGCAPQFAGRKENLEYLQYATDRYLSSYYLKGSSWSIMAVDLESGRILLNHESDRSLIPASGMKLLTSACALETLGPDYRVETLVGYKGSIDSAGTLQGDLIVVGAGDPSIATHFKTGNPAISTDGIDEIMYAWVDSVSARGICRINGNIEGYSGLFGGKTLGSGWEWSDLKYWFAAEVNPLSYADNCTVFNITPGKNTGDPAQIEIAPDSDYIHLYHNVTTADSGEDVDLHLDRTMANNIFSVWGSIPVNGEPQELWASVYNCDEYFLSALSSALINRGIECEGTLEVNSENSVDKDQLSVLFTHYSPPLQHWIRIINRDSQNLYAELLIRVLGVEGLEAGIVNFDASQSAFKLGRRRVLDWEKSLPGSSTGVVMADGSGLSRRNLTSASGIMKILTQMNRSPYRSEFFRSLANPGNGTLKDRFLGLPQGIYLSAKTGSMARIRSLSGYISTEAGPKVAFSIICNNYLCESAEADATIENIVQLLALYAKEGL
ncbi:D-alanyl-D-alanine carboxypeptidase/D-alanyl-D-alanine-endopeptidase [candidate division LCP-89 bacterium B3_LCP]|uniref:D-alanyl-D-alanine carboxypeptidase/D-alanyl-D-alanine-endopeptidase n=1 Tax=candidate division LCP-89 bacterium B3_LCP TaxID=2012998 RepID=A0A532V3H2_UNCL8|nr:MAG: D-alanyl-D-alanine carboxypeptidase/D-alanyl-D-alanine-endopeptidase [candidate division LCP-89 bacterium B3_LCP]